MQATAEESLLQHANNTLFTAIELANQGDISEAIDKFRQSINLFELLKTNGSPGAKEWAMVAIDEATAQSLHLELNMLSVIPAPRKEAPKTQPAKQTGAIFRVACRLDLVSCFLLSRDRPEELITDGTKDPINLYVEERGNTGTPHDETKESPPQAFLQLTPQLAYPLGPEVPCLRAKAGYFVFMLPEHRYYGIVFPEGYPEEAILRFQDDLARHCILCVETEDGQFTQVQPRTLEESMSVMHVVEIEEEQETEPKSPLEHVASTIDTGTSYVTFGIRSTSEFLRSGIEKTGSLISKNVEKRDSKASIPVAVQASVGFIKDITPGLVYISGGAAYALTTLAGYIGTAIGALIPGLPDSGLAQVGTASMNAIVGVLDELSGAGRNLIEGTQKASVEVATARFGDDAGKLTGNLIGIGLDTYKVVDNVRGIGIKSLAKAGIKSAGTGLVKRVMTPPSSPSTALSKRPISPAVSDNLKRASSGLKLISNSPVASPSLSRPQLQISSPPAAPSHSSAAPSHASSATIEISPENNATTALQEEGTPKEPTQEQ